MRPLRPDHRGRPRSRARQARPLELARAAPSSRTCQGPSRAAESKSHPPSIRGCRRRVATLAACRSASGRHARSRWVVADLTGALRSDVRRSRGTATHRVGALPVSSPSRVTFRDGPASSPARSATLTVVSTLSASAARAALRAPRACDRWATGGVVAPTARRQRSRHAAVTILTVTGPIEVIDLRGRTWYEYRATVESRTPLPRTTVTPLTHIPTESG